MIKQPGVFPWLLCMIPSPCIPFTRGWSMQTDLNGKVAISVKAILKGTLLSFGAILVFSLVIAAYL